MQLSEFKRRRRQLMGMMGRAAWPYCRPVWEAVRNRDVHHRFRPDSDFYYLTGFRRTEAVMVLVPGRAHGEYILFCREKDPAKSFGMVTVRGSRAPSRSTAPMMRFRSLTWMTSCPVCSKSVKAFFAMGSDPALDKRVSDWVSQVRSRARAGVHGPIEFSRAGSLPARDAPVQEPRRGGGDAPCRAPVGAGPY